MLGVGAGKLVLEGLVCAGPGLLGLWVLEALFLALLEKGEGKGQDNGGNCWEWGFIEGADAENADPGAGACSGWRCC